MLHLYSTALRYGPWGSHSFTCHSHTNHTCLYSPVYFHEKPSHKASPPFGWYTLRLPMKRCPGWVDLGGCLHTEIDVPHRKLNPDMVTHVSSTNRAWRRLNSLIETNALPLHATTTPVTVIMISTLHLCNSLLESYIGCVLSNSTTSRNYYFMKTKLSESKRRFAAVINMSTK